MRIAGRARPAVGRLMSVVRGHHLAVAKPDRGVVRVHTRGFNQDGVLVAEFKRAVLVPRMNPGE